jgi:hypothetical protein
MISAVELEKKGYENADEIVASQRKVNPYRNKADEIDM